MTDAVVEQFNQKLAAGHNKVKQLHALQEDIAKKAAINELDRQALILWSKQLQEIATGLMDTIIKSPLEPRVKQSLIQGLQCPGRTKKEEKDK